MTLIRTIGIYFLFFSLPLIATLKGKGIVVSLFVAFFLFNGFSALTQFFIKKEWKNITCPSLRVIGIALIFLLFFLIIKGNPSDLLHFLRLIALLSVAFFTTKGADTLPLEEKRKIIHVFFAAYIVYGVFFLCELYGGNWISTLYSGSKEYDYNLFIRGVVILTFFFLPFSWLLKKYYLGYRYRLFLGLSLLILLIILIKAQPSAARLAVLVAGLFFIAGYLHRRAGLFILTSVGIYIIVAPFLFLHLLNRQTLFDVMHYLPSSYQHRIEIWNDTSKHIKNQPLTGYGFDSSSRLKEAPQRCAHHPVSDFKTIHLDEKVLSKTPYSWGGVICYKDTLLSTHPHNSALQIWLEFGLVGVGIFCLFLYNFGLYVAPLAPTYRGYLYSLFGLCLVYWNVSFGLWQNWMIALVALTFTLFQLIKGLPSKKKEDNECMN